MSKISCLINKKLIKTILSSSSLVSITKPPLKTSNFLTPILNFSINLTPRQNFISSSLSHARVINLGFNRNPRSFCSISSIDLKGLMAENQANLIQHTSGKTNYAVLKFGNATSETPSPDSEATLSDSSHSYMVVFPYGSTVTFNMLDDEVDGYLEIIKRHASGLLDTKGWGVFPELPHQV
ncbi:hypothetical protein MKX03_004393 [Papaver bracteatum]|nr:hypothetical protein MKX03_004393 [Papaver bracteatum]